MTLPGWVGVREPWGGLGGRYAKNVTICPTQACTKPAVCGRRGGEIHLRSGGRARAREGEGEVGRGEWR